MSGLNCSLDPLTFQPILFPVRGLLAAVYRAEMNYSLGL